MKTSLCRGSGRARRCRGGCRAGQVDEFGDAQPGLDREQEERVVASWMSPLFSAISSDTRSRPGS